jgi:hypothetical protein
VERLVDREKREVLHTLYRLTIHRPSLLPLTTPIIMNYNPTSSQPGADEQPAFPQGGTGTSSHPETV